MDALAVLLFLAFLLLVITLVGHGIWVLLRAIFRFVFRDPPAQTANQDVPHCSNCQAEIAVNTTFCARCGARQRIGVVTELLKDLAATERQLERFHRSGSVETETYQTLKAQIDLERTRLNNRQAGTAPPPQAHTPAPSAPIPPEPVDVPSLDTGPAKPRSVVPDAGDDAEESTATPPPFSEPTWRQPDSQIPPRESAWQSAPPPEPPPPPAEPRRRFSEMLTAFMEQSNIRWGEIIGGLLIIGCSTALVVSLWAQISAIPVLKFLIFTTVTAALFGVGLYTEHRWKLPTTSRGILTIATLLVPLNFLAIAAVSGGVLPQGVLVIGSELIAPALFLVLVYFAGRVLTPKWPHLLAVGVLGSSIGQLLIRHFSSPDYSPSLILLLGAFPILCYAGAAAWMLWIALEDGKIDETEAIAIFVTLGALTFAALLPFGLLLYKSGPASMSMMYLAPLVSLAGVPMLSSGTLLWKRTAKDLSASRTAGTSIAVLGTLIVISGMILAWPNPASVVPAALLNAAVLIAIAILLELPPAQSLGALCFALAFLVLSHVVTGDLPWQNLRVVSLLDVVYAAKSGQILFFPFALTAAVSAWFARKNRSADGFWLLIAAGIIGVVGLGLLTQFGFGVAGDPYDLSIFYALFAGVAYFLAEERRSKIFVWLFSGLILLSIYETVGPWLGQSFPWQTSFFIFASVCAIGAIVAKHTNSQFSLVGRSPLNQAALISSFVVLVCLLQANQWETTAVQSARMFWLAGIWFVLLWLNRDKKLFWLFQICLTVAVILAVKADFQRYDWYSYLPDAFLHPIALQVQGTALVILSLIWIGARFLVDRLRRRRGDSGADWLNDAHRLLNLRFSFDRVVLWLVLAAFSFFAIYGAWTGVNFEFTARGFIPIPWDLESFPHEYVMGVGSWILLALILIALFATMRQRRNPNYLLGFVFAAGLACPLLAGLWESQYATASAWRWLAAVFLVLVSTMLWVRERLGNNLIFGVHSDLGPGNSTSTDRISTRVRELLLVITLLPLLVLTIYPALRAIQYVRGYGPGGIFHALGDSLSYSLPLVIAGLVIIGFAWRERLVHYAFSAGLFFNLAVTIVFLLSVVAADGSMDRVVLIRFFQLNAIVCALYGIVWLSFRSRWQGRLHETESRFAQQLFTAQIGLALIALLSVLMPAAIMLILWPGPVSSGTGAVSNVYGWIALALTAGLGFWFVRSYARPLKVIALAGLLAGGSVLLAYCTARIGLSGWQQYLVLLLSLTVLAWIIFGARKLPQLIKLDQRMLRPFASNWVEDTVWFSTLCGAVVVLLVLRVVPVATPAWWCVAPMIAMIALAAALQSQTMNRGYLVVAALLTNFTTSLWLWKVSTDSSSLLNFLAINVAAACLAGILWLWLELRARRLSPAPAGRDASVHHFIALGSLAVMAYVLLVSFTEGVAGRSYAQLSFALGWIAVASLAALMIACLWDQNAKYAGAGIYLVGLVAAALGLRQSHLDQRPLIWAALMTLSIYSVIGGLLWRQRAVLLKWGAQLGIPPRLDEDSPELSWLQVFTGIVVVIVSLMAFDVDLWFPEWTLRITAALAVIIQALALTLVAPTVSRPAWRKAAFTVFALGAVFFGWAWLIPGLTGTWLNRAVIVMVEMFAFVTVFGLELDKALTREPDWTRAIRECIPWMTGVGSLALIFVLCTEVYHQWVFGAVHTNPLALVTVGLALIAASIICIVFALSPKRDPLALSDSRRQNYVYVSEFMLAVFFMHIRLTMPWLFTGFFERYWPLVVVALAYVGVAVSEILRRQNVLVLAHPIERTGVFLPLLPVLGFWITKTDVDYSVLLFIVGGLYGVLAILRSSFVFGMLAVLAGNGGLWYLWHRTTDFGFLQHPQLWLIPVALSVLVAAYINRRDFSEEQMIGIRYLSLLTIYVSSTADIFINGVATSPWLPLVLAALSLAGVFAGIMFRVRAFLLLGSVFLLLAITTMIYYASANFGWTWLWYVAGIVTGAMIIFTFAMFEKKREEMLRVVEGFREWQG